MCCVASFEPGKFLSITTPRPIDANCDYVYGHDLAGFHPCRNYSFGFLTVLAPNTPPHRQACSQNIDLYLRKAELVVPHALL